MGERIEVPLSMQPRTSLKVILVIGMLDMSYFCDLI